MADPATTAFGAIVGICAALVICVIALIVFVIVFCNLKIKNDNNIRKRVMANDAFNEVKTVQEAQPMIQPPAPIVVPAAPRPVTPPAVLPRAQTPPARIVIRER